MPNMDKETMLCFIVSTFKFPREAVAAIPKTQLKPFAECTLKLLVFKKKIRSTPLLFLYHMVLMLLSFVIFSFVAAATPSWNIEKCKALAKDDRVYSRLLYVPGYAMYYMCKLGFLLDAYMERYGKA